MTEALRAVYVGILSALANSTSKVKTLDIKTTGGKTYQHTKDIKQTNQSYLHYLQDNESDVD